MTYSIIKKSQLEGALRLDAEYYQPEYLDAANKITGIKYTTIKKLAEKVFSGPFGSTLKSESYQNFGIPFIRIGDISDIFIQKENLIFISENEHRRIYSTRLNPGDIVLSKIGTVGRLSVISNELGEVNISENNIGIRLQNLDENLRSFILFFLLGKYGQSQIIRKASGNIQLKLNVIDIENLILPVAQRDQNELFANYFRQITESRNESINFYREAENLLLKELGLENFKSEKKLFSIVNFSDCQKANRIDPDFYQQKYFDILSAISKNKSEKIKNIAKRINGNQKIIRDREYNYTKISDIDISSGSANSNKIIGKDLPANAKIRITGGELAISKVRPTRGAIAIIPEKFSENHIISGAFSVYEVNSPIREYLQVVLKSIIGKLQMERPTTGTSYPTITDQDVENLLIPILPKAIQEKIADFVRLSHSARQKSKELLESAKKKVEELIEKEGD